MRKLLAVLLATFAAPACTSDNIEQWRDRLEEIKARYGERYTDRNDIFQVLEASKPCGLGSGCRVFELESIEQAREIEKRVAKHGRLGGIAASETLDCRVSTNNVCSYYLNARDFLAQIEGNKEFYSRLPQGVKELAARLVWMCTQYDHCEKEPFGYGDISLSVVQGVISISIPYSDWDTETRLFKRYSFLISYETAQMLLAYGWWRVFHQMED